MRVGLLDNWLGSRYLPFWEPYLQALGVETVRPESAALEVPLPQPLAGVLGRAFSLKEQGLDFLLLPDAQLGVESRKGSPSPWMVDLGATLGRLVPGLPPVLRVPAELSPEVAGLAAEVGQNLTRNPMLARRALERTKRLLEAPHRAPKQGGGRLVGLVAQPMLADDPDWRAGLQAALGAQGLGLFLADRSPAELRQEGAHLELGLELPSDLEAAGMHRHLARLGKVGGLLYVHDPEYLPLPNPLRRLVRRFGPGKPWRMAGLEADWAQAAAELAKEPGL